MAIDTMPSPPSSLRQPQTSDSSAAADEAQASPTADQPAGRSVREIISDARRQPARPGGAIILSLLSALLMWAAFAPAQIAPFGWIALVPLILLVRLRRRTAFMYPIVYIGGLAFSVAALQWMRLGDVAMYPAWFALAAYMALYFPAWLFISRVAVHRWSVPLELAVPTVWAAAEYLRGTLMTGFAWYFLGHTQHRWTDLVQISDVTGVYGVSFLLALAATSLAQLVTGGGLQKLKILPTGEQATAESYTLPRRRQVISVAVTLAVLVGFVGYGSVRRWQADFDAGPRVALIQGNYPASLKQDPNMWSEMYRTHTFLTGQSVKHQPDVIIWPETMFRWPLLQADATLSEAELKRLQPMIPPERWADRSVHDALADLAGQAGSDLIIGIDAHDVTAEGYAHFNSSVHVSPEGRIKDRYDKRHRVPFGEYIPLRQTLPFLKVLTPFGENFGIDAGERIHVFNVDSWRLMPIICFEDTVPHLVREMTAAANASADRPVDVLVNQTNDGWFHGSAELDQHLITAAFRSIETRTPMVRAVNTGISAVIDGDGIVREPTAIIDLDGQVEGNEQTSIRDASGRFIKQRNWALIADVPLDSRSSLYLQWGDWFARLCVVLTALFLVGLARRPNVRSQDSRVQPA